MTPDIVRLISKLFKLMQQRLIGIGFKCSLRAVHFVPVEFGHLTKGIVQCKSSYHAPVVLRLNIDIKFIGGLPDQQTSGHGQMNQ